MPQRKTGIKELRKNHARKMHNMDIKTDLKKTVKSFLSTIHDKKLDDAKTQLKTIYKKFDKAAKRNVIHKNTASRRKAHYTRILNGAAVSSN